MAKQKHSQTAMLLPIVIYFLLSVQSMMRMTVREVRKI